MLFPYVFYKKCFCIGTLIDGRPVITLPPKTIILKRVDFSDEEHEFYLALEAESREKFKASIFK